MSALWGVLGLLLSTAAYAAASTPPAGLNDTLTAPQGAQSSAAPTPAFTIVIDAGHGGRDAGCSGAHSQEKHLALDLSLALGELVSRAHPGVRVLYTRERDVFVPLHERARVANAAQADLFVSIHCNFLPGADHVHGSESYVMGLHTAEHNLRVAKRENAAVRLEADLGTHYDFDPDSPAGHITLSMFQHAFLEQSIAAAEAVESALAEREGRRSRGVRQAGFVVLKETAMPSVLVESGYLSNAAEEDYLASDDGQARTPRALARGIGDYIDDVLLERSGRRRVLTAQETSPTTAPTPTTVLDPVTDDTQYYVQVAASREQVDTEAGRWTTLSQPVRYLREGGLYKYQAGPVASAAAADALRREALAAGFRGSWVVAYRDGERVPVD